jgi:hypothetical protein
LPNRFDAAQQLDDPARGARAQAVATERQQPSRERRQSVDILCGVDEAGQSGPVEMVG